MFVYFFYAVNTAEICSSLDHMSRGVCVRSNQYKHIFTLRATNN